MIRSNRMVSFSRAHASLLMNFESMFSHGDGGNHDVRRTDLQVNYSHSAMI